VGRLSLVGFAVPDRDLFMPSTSLRGSDIRAVYAARQPLHGQFLTLYVRRRAEGSSRTAVVAGRRIGTAVDRNRARRRLRALLATQDVPSGVDMVLVAKPGTDRVTFALLAQDYRRVRERLAARMGQAA
jgi:ribonuclease P protein component